MATLTAEEFVDCLKKSALLSPQECEEALASIKRETPDVFKDSNLLAAEFVKRNLLTTWHIRQLLKRKYKGFYLRQYRILSHLGSGGMSSVYLGEHTVMKRRVAIKVLPKKRLNDVYLDRFAREAQAIASLDSQHVVRAYDVDQFEDVHYIVMEYFEGKNLRQLLDKKGQLPYEEIADYIRQAALGLADAHKCGIVHRDVKPENIVVNSEGVAKVLDLGLALLDENSFSIQGSLFDEDKILGTADYLAPEQALNSHTVDARADVYGLGATLYFCLTGSPPFPKGTISERLLAHQRKEPASIFNERPDAPVDLVEICSKMMAKKPENRFQTAKQVAEIMKRWLIKHGFAKPNDFTTDRRLEENDPGFGESLSLFGLENRERSKEKSNVLDDGSSSGTKSNGSDGAVDLFDSSESGGSVPKLNKPGDILLSQNVEVGSSVDPWELALGELSDTTKTQRKQESVGSNPKSVASVGSSQHAAASTNTIEAPNVTNGAVGDVDLTRPNLDARRQESERVQSGASRPASFVKTQTSADKQEDTSRTSENTIKSSVQEDAEPIRAPGNFIDEWYNDKPWCFWAFAVGGYALAIFLAGILCTVILTR